MCSFQWVSLWCPGIHTWVYLAGYRIRCPKRLKKTVARYPTIAAMVVPFAKDLRIPKPTQTSKYKLTNQWTWEAFWKWVCFNSPYSPERSSNVFFGVPIRQSFGGFGRPRQILAINSNSTVPLFQWVWMTIVINNLGTLLYRLARHIAHIRRCQPDDGSKIPTLLMTRPGGLGAPSGKAVLYAWRWW